MLLNLNESCLRRYGFDDPWCEQKKLENDVSIVNLKSRLNEIDAIKCNEKNGLN